MFFSDSDTWQLVFIAERVNSMSCKGICRANSQNNNIIKTILKTKQGKLSAGVRSKVYQQPLF